MKLSNTPAPTTAEPLEPVAFVVENRFGHGSGHLVRSARLAIAIEEAGGTAVVVVRPGRGRFTIADARALLGPSATAIQFVSELPAAYRLVVFDTRSVDDNDLQGLDPLRCVGLDVAGTGRRRLGLVLDMLIAPARRSEPNLFDHRFLPGGSNQRDDWPQLPRRVLVIGGGQRGGYTFAAQLIRRAPDCQVTLVGSYRQVGHDRMTIAARVPQLAERLWEYDLVVTHYGVLVHEALEANVPVLLRHRSRYHAVLGRRSGLIGARWWCRLGRKLAQWPEILEASKRVRPPSGESLQDILLRYRPPQVAVPAAARVIQRDADRTHYRERGTRMIYGVPLEPPAQTYGDEYFFQEYRRQYGRTYLEDFDHIAAMGHRRVADIGRIAPLGNAKLLELGCAFGPFLHAAAQAGASVCGVDLNPSAVQHVKTKLGLPAVVGNIDDLTQLAIDAQYDIVALWYVIEHVPDPERLLRQIAALLPPGGLLCFATPNANGISGRRNMQRFLERNPIDHYTAWSPASARRFLARLGFRVLKTRTTGHHPERFPYAPKPETFAWRAVDAASRGFGLGDTFEVIARKVGR